MSHPSQIELVSDNPVDDRTIIPADFAPLHRRFNFTIDAAASSYNARLPRFWTPYEDALAQDWTDERVWVNPPYSTIEPWCQKAWREVDAELVVMLVPANRTDQGWWHAHVEQQRRDGLLRVEFLPGRMRFLKRGQRTIGPNERPQFGVCLLIWGDE